jgi:hypothetical protein
MVVAMTRFLFTLAVGLALTGCPRDRGPAEPAPAAGGIDERQACTADADCVAVEIGCCDHCNGGTVVGVHRRFAARIREQYADRARCRDTTCTEMACGEPPPALCKEGVVCGLRVGTREEAPPLPPP